MINNILQSEINKRGISVRQAAHQIGVAHTTIQRIMDGQNADLGSYEKVSRWLNIDLATLLELDDPNSDKARIEYFLESNPKLLTEFNQRINNGAKLSPDAIQEVIDFLVFKIQVS